MLGQQITVSAATKLTGKLEAALGVKLYPGNKASLTHVFPPPAIVAATDLTSLGMPGARARAISTMAAAAHANPQLFAIGRGYEPTIAKLCALPGIGDWTAQYIAIRAQHEPAAFPPTDIGLLRAMTPPGGSRPLPLEILARSQSWRPWRAYAALHLWAAGALPTTENPTDEFFTYRVSDFSPLHAHWNYADRLRS